MIVIDARSGLPVRKGQTVTYPDGHWWRLCNVHTGFTWAVATIENPQGRHSVPMPIRFFHPGYALKRVAIFPS